jgi:hypothetical protein
VKEDKVANIFVSAISTYGDGNEQNQEVVGTDEDVRDNTWKIIVGSIHAPDTAIAL